MRHFLSITFFALTALASAAFAQKWEVGAAGGGSFFTSETVTNPAGNAQAGVQPPDSSPVGGSATMSTTFSAANSVTITRWLI